MPSPAGPATDVLVAPTGRLVARMSAAANLRTDVSLECRPRMTFRGPSASGCQPWPTFGDSIGGRLSRDDTRSGDSAFPTATTERAACSTHSRISGRCASSRVARPWTSCERERCEADRPGGSAARVRRSRRPEHSRGHGCISRCQGSLPVWNRSISRTSRGIDRRLSLRSEPSSNSPNVAFTACSPAGRGEISAWVMRPIGGKQPTSGTGRCSPRCPPCNSIAERSNASSVWPDVRRRASDGRRQGARPYARVARVVC